MLLSGVIEGFYGPPWTPAERIALFDRMASCGLNTYLYCPKDDLHHRAIWREPYGPTDVETLAVLAAACRARDIRFVYGLGPGLDIRYGDHAEQQRIHDRFTQMLGIGCDGVALLFDDIPDRLDPADVARWGSLAAAQAQVANSLCAWVHTLHPHALVAFCPTPYCGRMALAHHGGEGYLEILGATLAPEIEVFWTGPEIVSREIPVAHVRDLAAILRRKPVIWDNLHANDYDSRRIACGPYAGRPLALRDEVRGLLSNPNTEFPLNEVPLRTLAAFVHTDGPWDPRRAYLQALQEWRPSFDTVHGPIALDDLVLLGDCFYLPYEEGPRARRLYDQARGALAAGSPSWRDDAAAFLADGGRLRDLCGRLSTLRDRALFHALHRRLWDLREELDLLIRVVEARLQTGDALPPFHSGAHLPGTCRGGMITRLQQLLAQHPDGAFTSAHDRARQDDDSWERRGG
ncbi:MAG: beta-N-acetylglucosaminidase domain-containing protein [Acidobacteria bacterium]|nr:beta-N-acetylglucosaminidase domain-containing protein [Acidobacteriota bacterium]